MKRYINQIVRLVKSNPKKSLAVAAIIASSLAPQYKNTIDLIVSTLSIDQAPVIEVTK